MKKERKLYLWDWSAVGPPGPRFENLVGTAVASDAQTVGVTFGEERTGIDITLSLAPVVRREGTVIGPGGPLPQMQVALTPDPSAPFVGKGQPTERRWWRPDARRLAFTRPATDGESKTQDLRIAR